MVLIDIVQPDLGGDTTVCPGELVSLDAGNPTAQFIWSTGDFNQNIQVADSGLVQVLVTIQGCQVSDEMEVIWFDAYPLDLEEEVVLCLGEEADLDALVNGWDGLPPVFQWSNGPADSEYTVTDPGMYTVTATVYEVPYAACVWLHWGNPSQLLTSYPSLAETSMQQT